MPLNSTANLSLDFYNNNIKTVNAVQWDAKSRYLNISCTEHGKKVMLDPSTMSAIVRYKKPDNYYVLNDCEILSDGIIRMELTQQMLAVQGRATADLIILDAKGIKVANLVDITSVYDLNVGIISTMKFILNIQETAIEHCAIESSSEFNALLHGLSRSWAIEVHLEELSATVSSNEETRISNENARKKSEVAREQTIAECKTATTNCNTATSKANTATTNANNATTKCKTATTDANTATARANEAAKKCEAYSENFASLDSTGNIPLSQLGNVHKIYYGTTTPSSSLGKNGDIYMMIIG